MGVSCTRRCATRRSCRAASTVLVAGHSYLDAGFSTVTEVVDTGTGTRFGNLETYRIIKDGGPTAART